MRKFRAFCLNDDLFNKMVIFPADEGLALIRLVTT
jgi:hypothetical protein